MALAKLIGALFLVISTVGCDIGFPELKLPKVGGEQYHPLVAMAACTERGCPPNNPCCNSCTFEGWRVQTPDGSLSVSGRLPPPCTLDGCGKCLGGVVYEARGEAANNTFQVKGFRQVKTGPSVQVVLTARVGCTELGCPEDNPDCNGCSFDGWGLPDQYVTADPYATGALPTCEQLGGCEGKKLNATGKFAGRQFIVETWQVVGESGNGDPSSGSGTGDPGVSNGGATSYLLEAGAQCTKKGCSPENPCCNSCLVWGWMVDDPKTGFTIPAIGQLPPNCEVDGCGKCKDGNHFRAEGQVSDGKLQVTRWWDTREQSDSAP